MLEKSALEVVENSSPGFDSRIFLVEKASDSWRSVIDLSPLNQFAMQTGFKVETVANVMVSIREDDFTTSLDLKDAYFPSGLSEISPLCLVRDRLTVQAAVLRTVDGSSGLHLSFCSSVALGSFPRHQAKSILVRLAGPNGIGAESSAGLGSASEALS